MLAGTGFVGFVIFIIFWFYLFFVRIDIFQVLLDINMFVITFSRNSNLLL